MYDFADMANVFKCHGYKYLLYHIKGTLDLRALQFPVVQFRSQC